MNSVILLAAIVLSLAPQPPAPARPQPAAPAAESSGRPAIERVSAAHRKLITDRARDIFELSTGQVLDLARINRIRDHGAKGYWPKIKARDLLDLGAGHKDYNDAEPGKFNAYWGKLPATQKFVNLPGLAAFSEGDDFSDAVIILTAPHAGPLFTTNDMFIQTLIPTADQGDRVVVANPGSFTISHIINGGALVTFTGYARHENPPFNLVRGVFFAAGSFSGLSDDEQILTDAVLFRTGTHTYADPEGGRHTVPAFRLEWLKTPVTPAHLAELIEAGRPLVTWSFSTSGSTTTCRAIPQKITFKPE